MTLDFLGTDGVEARLAADGRDLYKLFNVPRGTLAQSLELAYGPRRPMDVVTNLLRGMIVSAPGRDLIVADFTAIEARGIAWLAGSASMLAIFAANQDIYLKAAEDIYGYPCNKKDHPYERGVGKVVILACGYQGAVGAFQSMARGYNVTVSDADARKIVKAWREANPEIVELWATVEAAALGAVAQPGLTTSAGAIGREVQFLRHGSFLFCRLPSGRALAYAFPKLVPYVWIKRTAYNVVVSEETGLNEYEEADTESRRVPASSLHRWIEAGWKQNGEPGPALHYCYVDEGRWVEGPTYGGSLCENITQAVCRDLLAEGLIRVEAAGYPVVLHVHDEAVAEVAEGFGSVSEFEALLTTRPLWAEGFPITAAGWRGKRYRKD